MNRSLNDNRAQLFSALGELAAVVPEMRAGQILAAVGELCADLHGRGLWECQRRRAAGGVVAVPAYLRIRHRRRGPATGLTVTAAESAHAASCPVGASGSSHTGRCARSSISARRLGAKAQEVGGRPDLGRHGDAAARRVRAGLSAEYRRAPG